LAEEHSGSPFGPRFLELLEPDAAVVKRVKASALSAGPGRRSRRSLVVAIVALATVIGGGYSVWRRPPSQVETVTVLQSNDDLMLVRTEDGRQWVLGPSHIEPAPGTMELVLEGGD
jgi:hypothetical protein